VEMARRLGPDVITLDVEMPKMDGLSALSLLAKGPWKVIMLSSYTTRGAQITMKALEKGAVDFVPKPGKLGDLEKMSSLLLAKIEAAHVSSVPKPSITHQDFRPPRVPEIVVVGASTGGPATLTKLFSSVKGPMPWPTVIGLHMLPGFTGPFAQHLQRRTGHRALELSALSRLERGSIHIIPGGHDGKITGRGPDALVEVIDSSAGYSPCIDKLLQTAADSFGAGVLALIMTGMGHDGLKGASAVKGAGGTVIAQDEASSVIWGMPKAVVDAELADAVLSVENMAETLNQLVGVLG